VVAAVLWAVALAATVWILVPAIAFAFRAGGIRTDVLPDVGPPTLPADEPTAQPTLAQLGELGFRAAGRTVQSGRFVSPTHWTWQQLGTTLWLVSADGGTYATLYRLVPDEPLRLSAITMFENGGFVRTACPGASAKDAWRPHYWRLDVRGVSAGGVIAKHQEQVAAFAREHGPQARAATIAELTAASDAAERPLVRKLSASGYGMVAAFAPALMFPFLAARGRLASTFVALGICVMAGFYALLRWAAHGPLLHYFARRSHTEDLSGEPDDIAPDGSILATGKYERWLRLLALPAAVVTSVWPIALAMKLSRAAVQGGAFAIVFQLVMIAGVGMLALQLFGRARGRIIWLRRGHRNPRQIWTSLLFLNCIFTSWLDWGKGGSHRVLYVVAGVSCILGLLGWTLERKRGK
jgi:hypothetical protein